MYIQKRSMVLSAQSILFLILLSLVPVAIDNAAHVYLMANNRAFGAASLTGRQFRLFGFGQGPLRLASLIRAFPFLTYLFGVSVIDVFPLLLVPRPVHELTEALFGDARFQWRNEVILPLLLVLQKEDILRCREDAVSDPFDGAGWGYPIHGGQCPG